MSDLEDKKKLKSVKNRVVRENHLDYLQELHEKGVQLPPEDIILLKKHKRIEVKTSKRPKKKTAGPITTDPKIKTGLQQEADSYIDVIEKSPESEELLKEDSVDLVAFENLMDKTLFAFRGGKEITKDDWMPDSILHHTTEFVQWIDSILSGFQNMIHYKPFQMYCQQAGEWIAENGKITDHESRWDRKAFADQEYSRCADSSLYAMDKYLMLKEGDLSDGSMKYVSKPVHKVMCFLVDCGYSMFIGKGRQIAATSTLAGISMFKMIFKKNYFIKMIAQDKEKIEEIFDDKIKYPFGELPTWMKPSVSNYRDNFFRLGKKGKKKGSQEGVGSKIQVIAPKRGAINGGSPPLVMIDEAGYIGMLGEMMKEARPTMFMQDPVTGLLKMKRQVIAWGTGGEMDKGGKAYEIAFFDALDKWKNGLHEYGFIPLFFDWTCRPGMTQKQYDTENKVYTVEGPDKDKFRIQFRQHYPSIIEDMFLTSAKTLVSIEWINQNIERIRKVDHKLRARKGYFEPIFDTTSPASDNSDVPFKIVGAEFVPTSDGDKRASCTLFMEPEKNWIHRYYAGTDPIMSDNGYSNMATAIWDKHYNTISGFVDYRDSNHKHTFLQCMLLSIYFGAEKGLSCQELVESNIGTAYVDYKDNKGYYDSLVYRTELPEYMQGGSTTIGIDNRGNRNGFIINKMHDFLLAYGEKIWVEGIFIQLRTFTCKVTDSGKQTWGVQDVRKYHDDVLFAATFAYICSLCYAHIPPKEIKSEQQKYRTEFQLRRDDNGELYRARVRIKIH